MDHELRAWFRRPEVRAGHHEVRHSGAAPRALPLELHERDVALAGADQRVEVGVARVPAPRRMLHFRPRIGRNSVPMKLAAQVEGRLTAAEAAARAAQDKAEVATRNCCLAIGRRPDPAETGLRGE